MAELPGEHLARQQQQGDRDEALAKEALKRLLPSTTYRIDAGQLREDHKAYIIGYKDALRDLRAGRINNQED